MIEFDGKEDYIVRPQRESRDGFFRGNHNKGLLSFWIDEPPHDG